MDRVGNTAIHSGPNSLGIWTQAEGDNVAFGGNLLAINTLTQAIVDGFVSSCGQIGDRLVAENVSWPVAELRCDWNPDTCQIEYIATAWDVYKLQLNAYIQRALDPREAPSYGVPGDE